MMFVLFSFNNLCHIASSEANWSGATLFAIIKYVNL